jgi:uncharacterized protein (TIGR03000 family)
MYSVVLLAALSSADGAVGVGKKAYPTPMYHSPGMPWVHYPAGGYHWPGYACWGGCGGYASPAYGFPMTPLVNPPPPLPDYPDEDNNGKKPEDRKKPKDDDDPVPPKKPKKPSDDTEDVSTVARITFLLPAGAKLFIDGRPVEADAVKTFRTPSLEVGHRYYYEVKVERMIAGMPVVETRQLVLKPGSEIRADFRHLSEARVVSTK